LKLDPHLLEQWALWAGQHALPLFFVMLALTLATTCACWWMVRRYSGPAFLFAQLPTRFLSLRVAVGMTVILLGSFIFIELAGELGTQETVSRVDLAFTEALRDSVTTPVVQIFAMLTHLGDTATLTGLCIAVAIALMALGRWWLMLGWVAAVAGNGVLNTVLKQIFARVRPLGLDGLALEEGFSFPSGHSSGSVVAYGMLAYLAVRLLPFRWHLPALMLAMTLAFAVGSSRLFLRVHFASDVIAGFASGAAWLALCVTAIELVRWLQQRRNG
jgi:membrane-associated phospholipid phosphatase